MKYREWPHKCWKLKFVNFQVVLKFVLILKLCGGFELFCCWGTL